MVGPDRITIVEVAAAAGYSVATVSRALRGFDNVSPTTMSRVKQVAADLGYRPSQLASRLRSGTTRAVVLMVPAINHWYFSELMAGTEELLAHEGYDTFVAVVDEDEGLDRMLSAVGPRGRVDGVLVADLAIDRATADLLDGMGIPMVSVGMQADTCPWVAVDDHQVGYTATRHLLDLGHTRIAVIRGRSHAVGRLASPDHRFAGYCAALREAGIDPEPDFELEVPFSVEGGVEAASTLVGRFQQPTALFCMSDLLAVGATYTYHQLGYRIPDAISIIGVDDHEMAEVLGITTIRQSVSDVGAMGARLLLDLLDDPSRARNIQMPTELVVRCSTGPPPPVTAGSRAVGVRPAERSD